MNFSNRICLIDLSTPSYSPYLRNYINLFDSNGVKYDVICWDRYNNYINEDSRFYVYKRLTKDDCSIFAKICDICKFVSFASSVVRKNGYLFLVLFTIPLHLFFYIKHLFVFKFHYILDIRDYSFLLQIYPLKVLFKYLIKKSDLCVISSEGFLKWLPSSCTYVKSNNFILKDFESINVSNPVDCRTKSSKVSVLTIGRIRDFDANSQLIEALGNNENYELLFWGDGLVSRKLELFSLASGYKNVFFNGKYCKSDEVSIAYKSDIINIFMPNDLNSKTLISNRFYLSVFLGKPMIVNKNTHQGYLTEKYNLGVVVDYQSILDINKVLDQYLENFDLELYAKGRELFISDIKEQELYFEHCVKILCARYIMF